jgi:hypothetical protein
VKLCYSLDYCSSNSYYRHVIYTLMQQCGICGEVLQTRDKIFLFLDDSKKNIEALFALFATDLPLSIFMGSHQIEEEVCKQNLAILPQPTSEENISFLTPSLIRVLCDPNSSRYFLPCVNSEMYCFSDGHCSDHLRDAMIRLWQALQEGKRVGFKYSNRMWVFTLCRAGRHHALTQKGVDSVLFVIDPYALESLFQITEREMHVVNAMERPRVRLFFHSHANYQDFSDVPSMQVRMPFDPMTVLWAKIGLEHQIPYLYMDTLPQCDLFLSCPTMHDGTIMKDCEVMVLSDRTLIVRCASQDYLQQDAVYDSTQELQEDQKACLLVRMEQGIDDMPSAGVYLSLGSRHSCFSVCLVDSIPKPLVIFDSLPASFQEIFDVLESMDDSSVRLVKRVKRAYPQTFRRLQTFQLNHPETLEGFLIVCGMCMGYDSVPMDRMYLTLMAEAHMFAHEGSVKLDMRLLPRGDRFVFDWKKTVRSVLSFRLANVPKEVLAYAIFESLSDFIGDNLHDICKKLNTPYAVLCGDFFGNRLVAKRLLKHATHLYTPLFNRQFPMDGNFFTGDDLFSE